MRKINKLGKRAAALVLAVGLTLSTAAPVLAADADEAPTSAAQTEQQEETASGVDTLLPTERTEDTPVVVLPDQLPADSGSEETPVTSDAGGAAKGDYDGEIADYKGITIPEHEHEYTNVVDEKAATCTQRGYVTKRCKWSITIFGKTYGCDATETTYYPALGHNLTDWIVEPATCTTAGKSYKACQRDGCTYEEVDEDYTKENPALGHDFEGAEWIIEPATCTTAGKRYQVCQRDGCNVENVDETYTEEHPALDHAWGEYVDDDRPACEQQTETAHCTREGCTATDTRNLPNFGADGNPLPHKYTKYTVTADIAGVPITFRSTCDYCGDAPKDYTVADWEAVSGVGADFAMDTVKVGKDSVTADEYAAAIVKEALDEAQKAVQNAENKEEALNALYKISDTVRAELKNGIEVSAHVKISGIIDQDVKTTVTFTDAQLDDVLKPLDEAIDSLKDTLDDSFLSQKTITSVVNKLADDTRKSNAPKDGINQIIYNTVYDAIYNIGKKDDQKKTTDNTPAVEDMVLQLVKDVVQSDKGWNDLTDSLVNDAVKLAVDELMKDETYSKLLKTKLGKATLDEVQTEITNQLVNDPTFMNQVRNIANKAVTNAQKGVDAGWSNEKIMSRLQEDLLPDVTDLISGQIDKLGESTGTIVDNKVSDTVHKFLPGKLGDWVSDKIGGKVNDAVTGKVSGLNKDVTDLISTTIKQLTCTHVWGDRETLKNPTCTEDGQTGVVCTKCRKVKDQEPIPATGHTPVADPAVAPTETTDGLTEGSHCSTCGAVLQAQEVVPMLDPTIDTWFSRAATTEADAKAAGFDSVDAANAALDAALTAAGFDPANAEHFTVQVNSSIGVLPNDRFPESGVTGKLTLPEGTRGKTAQTYYAVQMFTADTRFHKAGDVVVTPVSIDTYAKTGLQFTVYSEAVMAIAWKAQ